MFKSIGKAISNAYNSVKTGISNAIGYVTGSKNVASANTFGSSAYNAQNVKAGLQPATGVGSANYGASGTWSPAASIGAGNAPSTGINSGGGAGAASYGPQLPVTISAGRQSTSGSSSPTLNLSGYNPAAFAPTTISARTLGAQTGTPGGASLQSTGGSIGNSVSLSSAPTSVNPGTINNTGLAGTVAGYKQYNAKTGQFDDIAQTPETTLDSKVQKELDILKKYMPEKESVFEDPQVIAARNERQRLQQALQVPTAELNAIVAKQNQDLLQLRQTGSQEGVTEAVYGGQQNAINYNAAIRALPLQASIAGIQGDLKLAQDYLTELTQIKQDQINKQYEYNKGQFEAIKGVLNKEDERAYKEITTANDRSYQEQQNLIKAQSELLTNALSNKAPQSVINRISNAGSIQDAIMAAGQYAASGDNQIVKLDDGRTVIVDKNTGAVVQDLGGAKGGGPNSGVLATLPTSIQGKIISIANGFGDKPNIKKYIEAIDSNNIVRGIDPKSKNPADHQQIVYAFAKALDPDSAVKEGEYDTIKKYAQSSISKYGKEITNAINGTGFLSEKAIENIQTTINNTLESRKTNYLNSVKETRKIINNIAGTDVADEIMIDYSGGIKNESVTNNTAVDFTATLDNIFK